MSKQGQKRKQSTSIDDALAAAKAKRQKIQSAGGERKDPPGAPEHESKDPEGVPQWLRTMTNMFEASSIGKGGDYSMEGYKPPLEDAEFGTVELAREGKFFCDECKKGHNKKTTFKLLVDPCQAPPSEGAPAGGTLYLSCDKNESDESPGLVIVKFQLPPRPKPYEKPGKFDYTVHFFVSDLSKWKNKRYESEEELVEDLAEPFSKCIAYIGDMTNDPIIIRKNNFRGNQGKLSDSCLASVDRSGWKVWIKGRKRPLKLTHVVELIEMHRPDMAPVYEVDEWNPTDKPSPPGTFNTFRGLKAIPLDDVKEIDYTYETGIGVLINLLAALTKFDQYGAGWFLKWLSVVVSGQRTRVAPFLFSQREGAGKGQFMNFFIRGIMGSDICKHMTGTRSVDDKFNAWIEKTRLAFLDEAAKKSMSSADSQLSEHLMTAITESRKDDLQDKNVKQFGADIHIEFVQAGNSIPRNMRRRMAILDASPVYADLGTKWFTQNVHRRIDVQSPAGARLASHFLTFLLNWRDPGVVAELAKVEIKQFKEVENKDVPKTKIWVEAPELERESPVYFKRGAEVFAEDFKINEESKFPENEAMERLTDTSSNPLIPLLEEIRDGPHHEKGHKYWPRSNWEFSTWDEKKERYLTPAEAKEAKKARASCECADIRPNLVLKSDMLALYKDYRTRANRGGRSEEPSEFFRYLGELCEMTDRPVEAYEWSYELIPSGEFDEYGNQKSMRDLRMRPGGPKGPTEYWVMTWDKLELLLTEQKLKRKRRNAPGPSRPAKETGVATICLSKSF